MSAPESTSDGISSANVAALEVTYDTKRRTLFRWQELGRQHNDPAPLSRPEEMLAWWQRRMKQRPPAKLLSLAERKPAEISPAGSNPAKNASSSDTTTEAKAKERPASTPVDLTTIKGASLATAVERLQIQLAAHQQALEDAMTKGSDDSTLQLRQRNVNVTIDLLRKCEATLDEQRRRRGDLIDIADVQEDWGNLLRALAAMRERMAIDVAEQLASARDAAGKPIAFTPDQVAAVKTAVLDVRSREDEMLRRAKFWTNDDVARPAA